MGRKKKKWNMIQDAELICNEPDYAVFGLDMLQKLMDDY